MRIRRLSFCVYIAIRFRQSGDTRRRPARKRSDPFLFFRPFSCFAKGTSGFRRPRKKVVSEHVFKFIGGTHVKNKNTAVVQRGVNLIKRHRQVFPLT